MTTVLVVLLLVGGCCTAVCSAYLLLLAAASFFYSPGQVMAAAGTRLAVIVPAHDEALTIAECVRSLRAQSYARERYEIVVIADNCSDDTAAIARVAGAERVLERGPHDGTRGKGAALRWAIDTILSGDYPPKAFVIVDADSTADPDLLAALATAFERGAHAAQSDYVLLPGTTGSSALRAAAFLLVNRVRPAGRAALGLSASLVGNGMLLSTELLASHPWEAFTSTEDLEYSLDLQAAGVKIAYVGGASVRAPTAPNARAAATQQLRWEGGRVYLMRTRRPQLLLGGLVRLRPVLLWAALDLLTPPLGALAAIALAGAVLAAALAAPGVVPAGALIPWLIAVAAIPAYVLVGLRAGRAPRSAYRALLRAPLFVLAKPFTAARVLVFRPDSWVRTERAAADHTEDQP